MTRKEEAEEQARLSAEQEQRWINKYARPSTARYDLYCGKCRVMHTVETADMPDAEVWLCHACRPPATQ